MKIETIEETGRSGRLRLRFDDGRTLLALPAVIAEHGLYAGMELPEGAFSALLPPSGSGLCASSPPLPSPAGP